MLSKVLFYILIIVMGINVPLIAMEIKKDILMQYQKHQDEKKFVKKYTIVCGVVTICCFGFAFYKPILSRLNGECPNFDDEEERSEIMLQMSAMSLGSITGTVCIDTLLKACVEHFKKS